ncbi:VMAP-C domain-containing protein [Streptomyces sp. HD]|uniref:VMAP-C domain-containing protein n=1 Tax=Streptomyces sp. HD TaxID=3020892 RepID=UPI00232E68E4|nr:trypsin-like peptidase domain-containing protein [Streptomyces sp. HD]MDC0766062.1 trypsin-like peptidase domain-containing protein [Streptomyces sp. HD]
MSSVAWHARIVCGGEVGAGFLISPRRVLTCAHVVRRSGDAEVTVAFPQCGRLGEVPAGVVAHGGWAGEPNDPGDLAVLELDHEVPLTPAVFAPPDAEYGDPAPTLTAYGFPKGYDEGLLASFTAVSRTLIADEWVQLVATTGYGPALTAGYSGAAVTLPDNRVVGMVTSIAGGRDGRTGRMVPSHVMARHHPALGAMIPTPGHHPDAKRRLYALVERAVRSKLAVAPEQLYLDAVHPHGPPLPPEGFPDLWRAALFVQCEVPDPEAVTRFANRLAQLLHAPAPSSPPSPLSRKAAWSPILVELGRSGAGADQVTVAVSAYRDGQRRPVGTDRRPRNRVRAYVQQLIDAAFAQLAPGADELIVFVLPREWLNEPVAHWECSADDSTPLGCAHPLVVTEQSRHHSGRLRHELTKKWRQQDARTEAAVHRVDCGTRERAAGLRKRFRDDEAHLAAFAAPPAAVEEYFHVGINFPVPVLLWPRTGCPGPAHDTPCDGSAFLDELAASIAAVPPAELPRHVRALRETADASDDPARHWAASVQLLWDDPRCCPEPPASLHSPVA